MYKVSAKELEDVRASLLTAEMNLTVLDKTVNLPKAISQMLQKDIARIKKSVKTINSYIGDHEQV